MITRREFQKIVAGGGGSSMLVAKVNSVIDGVQLGVQSYSFRDRPLDDAIKAMTEIGLGECELWQGHVEPKLRGKELTTWRETVDLKEFEAIRKKFDAAGIQLF